MYANIQYDRKNYLLSSGIRKFYDLIDKLVIDFLGLRFWLGDMDFGGTKGYPGDWFDVRDFRIILVSELKEMGLWDDCGRVLKVNQNFNYAEMDRELLDDLCYKVLKGKIEKFDFGSLRFVFWKSARLEALKLVQLVMPIL